MFQGNVYTSTVSFILHNYMDKDGFTAYFFDLAECQKHNAYLGNPSGIVSKLIQSPSLEELNIVLMGMRSSAYLILPIS